MKLHTKTIVLILLLIISLIFLLSYFFYTKYKFLIDYIDSRTDLKLEKFTNRYNLDSLDQLNKEKEQDYINELKNNIINNNSENFFSKINDLSDIEEDDEEQDDEEQDDDEEIESQISEPQNEEELNYPTNTSPLKSESDTKSQTDEKNVEIQDDELPNLDNLDENIDNYIENILNENKETDIDTSLIEVEEEKKN